MLEKDLKLVSFSPKGGASPLEMYSKFVLANPFLVSQILKLAGKWPMADCYFRLWMKIMTM